MLEANFWQDKSNSQKIVKEKKLFEDLINSHNHSNNHLNDLSELYELALEENNTNIQNEVLESIKNLIKLIVSFALSNLVLSVILKFLSMGTLKSTLIPTFWIFSKLRFLRDFIFIHIFLIILG